MKRDAAEEQRLVDVLRPYQLEKLSERRHYGHWRKQTMAELLEHARKEFEELEWEVGASGWESAYPGAAEKVAREAADLSSICAMIADLALSRAEEKS